MKPGPNHDLYDLMISDGLELRGYTLEAELRYGRLAGTPAADSRLAGLLEAKGRRRDAWPLYIRAGQQDDTNSLFRLAVICKRRGESEWARHILDRASATLPSVTVEKIYLTTRRLADAGSKTPTHEMKVFPTLREDVDATFALGSMAYVLSNRADIARLAYSSALARGHSFSALSLLDVATPVRTSQSDSPLLRDALLGGFPEEPSRPMVRTRTRTELSANLDRLRDDLSSETFENLCLVASGGGREREAAIRRLGQTARLVTVLHGLRKLGCGALDLCAIEKAATVVGHAVQQRLGRRRNRTLDWRKTLDYIWRSSDRQLNAMRALVTQEEELFVGLGEPKVRPGSGIIHRLHREFRNIKLADMELLVLSLSGFSDLELAAYKSTPAEEITKQMFLLRQQLNRAQQGEQHPSTHELLWADLESAFA